MLDRKRLKEAFERLGADLVRRGLMLELAVYGGSALVLQYEWRRGTEDVDAVVRPGYDGDCWRLRSRPSRRTWTCRTTG